MSKKQSVANDQAPDEQAQQQIAELQQQIDELTAALQRERADAINQRRRFDEQIASVRTNVKTTVIAELLPVIDNFERALRHVPTDLAENDYVKGVQGIVRQFEKTLADMGVERIQTVGAEFDPRFHEAISMEEGAGSKEIVSEELQPGYKIGNDVIRHAMVRVRAE